MLTKEGKTTDFANLSLKECAEGNALDTDITYRLFKRFEPEIKKTYEPLYSTLIKRAIPRFAEIEFRGMIVDPNRLQELKIILNTVLEKRLKEFFEVPGTPKDLNLNSPKQIANYLYLEEWGLQVYPPMLTDKGAPSTGVECFGKIVKIIHDIKNKNKPKSSNDEELICRAVLEEKELHELNRIENILEKILGIRKIIKLRNTYITGIEKAIAYNGEDRIYVEYRLDGTVTGRLSNAAYDTKKGKMGVSFHTLPRDSEEYKIRSVVVATGDYMYCTIDYSNMELRVMAEESRDPNMMRAFMEGKDLHNFTASLVFNRAIESIVKDERQISKAVSFLVIYGGGAYRLAEVTNISEAEATKIIKKYKKIFPRVFTWLDAEHKKIKKTKVAITRFGARRHLENVRSPKMKIVHQALRQGTNFIIQRTASDILLYAMLDMQDEFERRGMGSFVVGTVHDSIEVLIYKGEEQEVRDIAKEKMLNYNSIREIYGIQFEVPFKIDIEVGKSF